MKVIKLASVTLINKLKHNIHILKIEQMACDFVKKLKQKNNLKSKTKAKEYLISKIHYLQFKSNK